MKLETKADRPDESLFNKWFRMYGDDEGLRVALNMNPHGDEEIPKAEAKRWFLRRLRHVNTQLEDALKGDGVIAFRCMKVEPDWVEKVRSGEITKLGEHWTIDRDLVPFLCNGHGGKKDASNVILEAFVHLKDFNWIDLFNPSWSGDSEEFEITPKRMELICIWNGDMSKKLYVAKNKKMTAEFAARKAQAKADNTALLPEGSEIREFYEKADATGWAQEQLEEFKDEWGRMDEDERREIIPELISEGYGEYVVEDPQTPEEWAEVENHFYALREREESDYADTTDTLFDKSKVLKNPTLVRFTSHITPEQIKQPGFEFPGYGPNNLGLTVHYRPTATGTLAFAFNKKRLAKKKDWQEASDQYGKYGYEFTVPYAVEAYHSSDGQWQTVFDVETVENLRQIWPPSAKKKTKSAANEYINDWRAEAVVAAPRGKKAPPVPYTFRIEAMPYTNMYRSFHGGRQEPRTPGKGQYGPGLYLAPSHRDAETFGGKGYEIAQIPVEHPKILFITELSSPGDDEKNETMLRMAAEFVGVTVRSWKDFGSKLQAQGFGGIYFEYRAGAFEGGEMLLLGQSALAVTASAPTLWYHLTDNAKFKLDPNYAPEDNAVGIHDRSGKKGIYLAKNVETWTNGHGYWRPFVVEFSSDRDLKEQPGNHGRYGGEVFVPAERYDQLKLERIIPLDAYAREQFGGYGWIEDELKEEFDSKKPIPKGFNGYPFHGYRYAGPDVREMPAAEITRLKKNLKKVKGSVLPEPQEETTNDWVITVPKTVDWKTYEKEIATVVDGESEMNFKVPPHFKSAQKGDRCYVCHDGQVKGWMLVTGLERYDQNWECTTTGKIWTAGTYLKRSGPFHKIEPISMKGFQGIRKFENPTKPITQSVKMEYNQAWASKTSNPFRTQPSSPISSGISNISCSGKTNGSNASVRTASTGSGRPLRTLSQNAIQIEDPRNLLQRLTSIPKAHAAVSKFLEDRQFLNSKLSNVISHQDGEVERWVLELPSDIFVVLDCSVPGPWNTSPNHYHGVYLGEVWEGAQQIVSRAGPTEADFEDEGMVDGNWGSQASGIAFMCGTKILLLKRAHWTLDPFLWGIPGGAVPVDPDTGEAMDPLESAYREVDEEIGGLPPKSKPIGAPVVFKKGKFRYSTYIYWVDQEFEPYLNDEHTDWNWYERDKLPRDTHPGVVWMLGQLKSKTQGAV